MKGKKGTGKVKVKRVTARPRIPMGIPPEEALPPTGGMPAPGMGSPLGMRKGGKTKKEK